MADHPSNLSRVHLTKLNEIAERMDTLQNLLIHADSPPKLAEVSRMLERLCLKLHSLYAELHVSYCVQGGNVRSLPGQANKIPPSRY
jgi:hypothetical protein